MRTSCRWDRIPVALTLTLALAACQQDEQDLPFALAPGESVDIQIGTSGGTVSLPPSFSLDIPANALSGTVGIQVNQLIGEPFPSSAGVPVPGTAYDLQPEGTVLNEPARVEIRVPDAALEEGQEVFAAIGVRRPDGTVAVYDGTFDLTNGVLSAEIDELGPVAAVLNNDVIAVAAGAPTTLDGGTIPLPTAPAPTIATADPQYGGVRFDATCSADPSTRQCYSSGLIRVWADEVVLRRIGENLFLVSPDVYASLEFLAFDANGIPTQVVGSVSVDGNLRARFNSSVDSYTMDEGVNTGVSTEPIPTGLTVSGNLMTFGETTNTSTGSIDFNEQVEFSITGIGTSEMLVVEVEAEVEFPNGDGTEEIGIITAHVRLRR